MTNFSDWNKWKSGEIPLYGPTIQRFKRFGYHLHVLFLGIFLQTKVFNKNKQTPGYQTNWIPENNISLCVASFFKQKKKSQTHPTSPICTTSKSLSFTTPALPKSHFTDPWRSCRGGVNVALKKRGSKQRAFCLGGGKVVIFAIGCLNLYRNFWIDWTQPSYF